HLGREPTCKPPIGCASRTHVGFFPINGKSSAGPQRAIQVERSADECKVRESLREVSQGLAAMTGLFRIEAKMVGKAKPPFENQSRFLEPRPVVATGSGQRLDQPKRADVEGAFLSG